MASGAGPTGALARFDDRAARREPR